MTAVAEFVDLAPQLGRKAGALTAAVMDAPRMLGRQKRARGFRPAHLSAHTASAPLPPPPVSVNWTKGITAWGMMLNGDDPANDTGPTAGLVLGDCTCAAIGHREQVATLNAGVAEVTEPNGVVLQLYEDACGYKLGDAATDQGGNEQAVLTFLQTTGLALADGTRRKIDAFFEVDPRNVTDVKRALADGVGLYLGIEIPEAWCTGTSQEWTLHSRFARMGGGHAVYAVAYDSIGVWVISWGMLFRIHWDAFARYVDEAWLIVDRLIVAATGKVPCGLTEADVEAAGALFQHDMPAAA